jgi:hypothetical protein
LACIMETQCIFSGTLFPTSFHTRPSGLFIIRTNQELWMLLRVARDRGPLRRGISSVSRHQPTQDNISRRNTDIHYCLQVGFGTTIPVSELAKIFHNSDLLTTAIGRQ